MKVDRRHGPGPGNTAVHRLPLHIRDEVHRRLASRYTVHEVAGWLYQNGFVNEDGSPKITEAMLYYYRERYVGYYEILGEALVSRFLNDMGVRVDPLKVVHRQMTMQMARVMTCLEQEKTAGKNLPHVGEEIDRLDRLAARAFRMMQDLGLLPKAPAEFITTTTAHVRQTITGDMTTHTDIPLTPEQEETFKKIVALGLEAQALKLGRQELQEAGLVDEEGNPIEEVAGQEPEPEAEGAEDGEGSPEN